MGRLDLVLFGATGFTGSLVAEFLAAHAPARLSWAIAGRDRAKLDQLAQRLRGLGGAGAAVRVRVADANEPESLRVLAGAARVVASTAGPFARLGIGLVEACVEQGSDYCDITGEPAFVYVAARVVLSARTHVLRLAGSHRFAEDIRRGIVRLQT